MTENYEKEEQALVKLRRIKKSKDEVALVKQLKIKLPNKLSPVVGSGQVKSSYANKSLFNQVKDKLRPAVSKKNYRQAKVWANSKGKYIESRKNFRRVVIKGRVVSQSTKVAKKNFSQVIETHIKYLIREGVGKDGVEPELFTSKAGEANSQEFAQKAGGDRHHFRFIISPEDGDRINLKQHVQDLVAKMENDLGTKLEWVAVEHHNTDNPHAHLLIRGKDQTSADLVIDKDYFANGIRNQSQKLVTNELGIRNEIDMFRGQLKAMEQERFLPIDRKIISISNEQIISGFEIENLPKEEQILVKKRLEYLTKLKIVDKPNLSKLSYTINNKYEKSLCDIENSKDIYKRISRCGLTEVRDYNKELPKSLVGKVVDKGLSNELYEKHYIILDGADGNKWHIDLAKLGKNVDAEVGNWVSLSSIKNSKYKNRVINVLAEKKLDEGLNKLEVTWADHMIIFPGKAGAIAKTKVGNQLTKSINSRKEILLKHKLGFTKENKFYPVKGMLKKLSALDKSHALVL